jgi:hypothetical protein
MGKPASINELQKQERLVATYEEKKVDLGEKVRKNNKALSTARTHLQAMIRGDTEDLYTEGEKE